MSDVVMWGAPRHVLAVHVPHSTLNKSLSLSQIQTHTHTLTYLNTGFRGVSDQPGALDVVTYSLPGHRFCGKKLFC